MEYLARNYPGWKANFVFNPRNGLLKVTLEDVRAEFEQEQQKMVFSGSVIPADATGIREFSEQYAAEYYVIHSRDVYWTGEKVAAAPERFRIFLAIDGGRVGLSGCDPLLRGKRALQSVCPAGIPPQRFRKKTAGRGIGMQPAQGHDAAGRNRQHSYDQAVRVDELQDRARAKQFDGPLADS